ncbi:hypothetical protein E8E13_008148 [Curvularia kusanoi]|uniref:Uncharacterized protein n=1 Tax=Curvularia kusanoi TaxID=90978 RepID=A0A9P4WAN1_CURKU|nr:hypothetical protein E8E13_008148 [Curvularia kusanoi]
MIFQRRFHSHTPTTIDTPPTPPPKDKPPPPKTLEEILAIVVSPRAPQPPPHAPGTVASKPRLFKSTPNRSASSPLKSSLPQRAPSSRKTGHATIRTDGVNGHDSFESDAFAVHMPTTRIPIIDSPIPQHKPKSPTSTQAEAIRTYKQKAERARERNDNVGVRVPPNIASYDYAYASTSAVAAAVPAILKPSSSPPAPTGAFPVSPPLQQEERTQSGARAHAMATSKISSNTSIYRKPTVVGVTTAASVIEESIHFVRADSKGGASRPTTPPKSTTVKISMKPKTPSPTKRPAVPAIKVEPVASEPTHSQKCDEEHYRGLYYRAPHVSPASSASRSPSPTKTMPNFTRQYSIEGDSIFGYKIKDPLGAVAGASKSVSSSSEDEKPKATASKARSNPKQQTSPPKRTIADRWPWIRKGAAVGKPPSAPAPDPPSRTLAPRRPLSTYKSPFETFESPSTTAGTRPVLPRPVAVAATPVAPLAKSTLSKTASAGPRGTAGSAAPAASKAIENGLQQVQSWFLLTLKLCLALYIVVALWFILDAVREALFAISVPLRFVLMFVWAVVNFLGRTLGIILKTTGGRVRVLGR